MVSTFKDLPLPVPLLKNSSSVGRTGRGLSMGIQYLCKINQLFIKSTNREIPDYMQLIFQLSCSRPFLNKLPNNL